MPPTDRHSTPAHCIRISTTQWDAYGHTVGTDRRSADLRAYIQWRLDNPTTPLPHPKRRTSTNTQHPHT